jgi:hypothetical protein
MELPLTSILCLHKWGEGTSALRQAIGLGVSQRCLPGARTSRPLLPPAGSSVSKSGQDVRDNEFAP